MAAIGCRNPGVVTSPASRPAQPTLDATVAPLSWLVGDWREEAGSDFDHWANVGGVLLGAHLGKTSFAAFIIDYSDADPRHALSFVTLSDDGNASQIGATKVTPQALTFASDASPHEITFAHDGDVMTIGYAYGEEKKGTMELRRVQGVSAPELDAADRAFSADTHARGVAGWGAAFAADGATWNGTGGWIRGPAAIEKDMAATLAELDLTWSPSVSRMGPTGDVGVTIGQYTATSRRSAASVLHGSYITVWRKQADGSWKVVIDSGRPAHSEAKRDAK